MPRKSPVIPVAINTMMVMIPAKMRTGRVSFPWFDGLSATNLITPAEPSKLRPGLVPGILDTIPFQVRECRRLMTGRLPVLAE